ncbi:MAG: beta-propeller domain-containing protein [Candidatus Peribacteraceae bacterium]|nr:beta-propeller domain-containing protein [Candidatus Peribacteraceae bacterium]
MFHDLPSPKKLMAGLAATAITLSLLPTGFAAFSDISGSTQYQTAIKDLETKGVLQGYADGTFKPKSGINRAEFLKILLESRGEIAMDGKNCFPDVADQWFARYVCAAKDEGIVTGYPDGSFKPDQAINFVEASKMLALAYQQQISQEGSDWYEGYALALESSKAIPPTVATLDAPLNRGEMAEMMWRLSEEKTDQPTKGYLNVKYTDVKINLSSDSPQLAQSCADLKAFTENSASGYGGGVMYFNKTMEDRAVAAPTANEAQMGATLSEGGSDDYSKTNVQVEGVDEGDRVKTDGSFLYVVSRRDHKVRIVDVRDPKNMKVVSTISFDTFMPNDLYIDGTKLAVTGQSTWANQPMPMMEDSASAKMMIYPPIWAGVQKSVVKIYDVTTKASPKEIRTVAFEGNTISTRLVGGKMLLVLNAGPRWYGPYAQTKEANAKGLIPLYDDSAKSIKDSPVTDCNRVTILPRVPRPQYLVIASIPLSASAEVGRTVILGNGQNVYASLTNLYVASPDWAYSWRNSVGSSSEKTNIYRFAYTTGGTEFSSQGSVKGHILNQFSMDENGDTFRIATTVSAQWIGGDVRIMEGTTSPQMTKSTNNLYVLNKNLDNLGSVTDIAPGESIYSVRFTGNRAYMVTFKQVDPLFVIDLTDARNPKILGKLKIPGYSNYLHPVDENHVLGFGKDVDESIDKDKVHSDDAVYYTAILGMKIALFDVTDVANPKELHKEVIGARGTDSPLLSDHKALLFDKERGLLAFPVTVYEKKSSPKVNEWDADTMPVFQGAYVYDFNVNSGFSLKGTITHHTPDDFMKSGDYWYDQTGLDIDRIVRINNTLFSVSEAKLSANALTGLRSEGQVDLATELTDEYPPMRMMIE